MEKRKREEGRGEKLIPLIVLQMLDLSSRS